MTRRSLRGNHQRRKGEGARQEIEMTDLQTFHLPESIEGTPSDMTLAREMVQAWRTDGIFQVALNTAQGRKTENAFEASRRFFPPAFAAQISMRQLS